MNMAVNTFLKITTVCKNEFISINSNNGRNDEKAPFI